MVSEEELSQEAVDVPAGHVSVVEQVSYDFEDEGKRFNGEGRTITVEFSNFILVACYVPNSGEDLKRLNYRIEEWLDSLISFSLPATLLSESGLLYVSLGSRTCAST